MRACGTLLLRTRSADRDEMFTIEPEPAVSTIALAASWLAGAWDQNTAFQVMSPAAARLEAGLVRRFVDFEKRGM